MSVVNILVAAIATAAIAVTAAEPASTRQPNTDTLSAAANTHATSSFLSFGFRLTFTQGFLAGQLSVVVIALFAVRYIIFEDARTAKTTKTPSGQQRKDLPLRTTASSLSGSKRHRKTASTSSRQVDDAANADVDVARIMADIMAKLQYEMDSHVSESIDWINVIVAQSLAGYRQDLHLGGWSAASPATDNTAAGREKVRDPDLGRHDESFGPRSARDWMEEILNANTVGRGMSFLDPIQVTSMELGDSYPIFSNAKVRPADDMGRMRVEVDVDYSDCISLAIETKLLINFPRPRFAVLPISLGLTVERFSGTLAIELFSNSPSSVLPHPSSPRTGAASDAAALPRSRHELHFSLHPDFALFASATSLVGARAKLQDLPKIEQLLVGRLRSYIHDRFVWPRYWTLTLPNLVPRHMPSRRTSKQGSKGAATDEDYAAGGGGDGAAQMHFHGPGDALADEKRSHGVNGISAQDLQRGQQHDDVFFETPPPLFPGVFQQQQHAHQAEHAHGVPGALPSVEAWRSKAALSSGGRGVAPSAAGSHRMRAGPPSVSSHAMKTSALHHVDNAGDRRPDLRQRAMYSERGVASTAPPSTGS